MHNFEMIEIPDDQLPDISELPEDLQIMADENFNILSRQMGKEEAQIMAIKLTIRNAQRFSGTPIRTGGIKTLLRNHRDKMIRQAADNGATILSLARKWHLDTRTISKIYKKPEPAARQLGLWEV